MSGTAALTRRRMLMLAPLGVAIAGGTAFFAMLDRMQQGTFDPHGVPNPLVGHHIPQFDLPPQPLPGGAAGQGFNAADLAAAAAQHPVLVNFFASWCVPCVIEGPMLLDLAGRGLPIWGIAYKDRAPDTSGFLSRNGNPYARIARDAPGRTAIDWGVYGVPESYLIDRQGVVRWRWAGPLTPEIVEQQLTPLLRRIS